MNHFNNICGMPMGVSFCVLVAGIVYLCKAEKKWAKLQKGDSLGKIFCVLGKPTSKKREAKNEEIWVYDSDQTIRRAITFHNGFLEKIETISKQEKTGLVCPKCKRSGDPGERFCKEDGEMLVFE